MDDYWCRKGEFSWNYMEKKKQKRVHYFINRYFRIWSKKTLEDVELMTENNIKLFDKVLDEKVDFAKGNGMERKMFS